MSKALLTKKDLCGARFGKLEVIGLSDKRGSRGARTVPLWECRCECGNITYKATDTLKNADLSMCGDCARLYAAAKMRENAGYSCGTQISRLVGDQPNVTSSSGARGVYYEQKSGKWRARLRFKRRLISLGTFTSFEEAVKARKRGEELIYGEFLEEMK